jgi:hypothetical protein
MLSNDQLLPPKKKTSPFQDALICAAVTGLLANPNYKGRADQVAAEALRVAHEIEKELRRA